MARTAMGISTTQLSSWAGAAPAVPSSTETRALLQMPFGFIHVAPATIRGPAQEWVYVYINSATTVPVGTPLFVISASADWCRPVYGGNALDSPVIIGVTQQEFPPHSAGFVLRSGIGQCLVTASVLPGGPFDLLTTPAGATPGEADVHPTASAAAAPRGTFGYIVQGTAPGLLYVNLDCRG
mgnify:CR=1 FL=1